MRLIDWCASTGIYFIWIPMVVALLLNSLLLKFVPVLCMRISGGPV